MPRHTQKGKDRRVLGYMIGLWEGEGSGGVERSNWEGNEKSEGLNLISPNPLTLIVPTPYCTQTTN